MKLTDLFKLLTHRKRLTILSLLRDSCKTAGELSQKMNLDRSEVKKHLKKLERAGLVKVIGRRNGEDLYDLSSIGVYRLLVKGSEIVQKRVFENLKGEKVLDLRGEVCPVPLTATQKEMERAEEGTVLEVWVDYPLSCERIIFHFKDHLLFHEKRENFWRIVLKK